MKKYKVLVLIIVAINLITSCKKYPDGPAFTIFTKEYRIEHKDWKVDYFSINGNDSSSYFKSPYYGKYHFQPADGDYDPRFDFQCNNPRNINTIYSGGFMGAWNLTNNKKDISIRYFFVSHDIMPPNDSLVVQCNWEIQRLTMKDFWLKANYNGKEYYLKLIH